MTFAPDRPRSKERFVAPGKTAAVRAAKITLSLAVSSLALSSLALSSLALSSVALSSLGPSSAAFAAVSGPSSGAGPGGPGPLRTISYRGYSVRVPVWWPVYRLAADPSRCVLFNRHAVYLGSPGVDQRCPVHAFGRTEALLVQPLGALTGLPPGAVIERGRGAAVPAGGHGALAAQDTASHELQFALPAAGVLVTATYGRDEALVRGILGGARLVRHAAASGPAARGQRAGAGPAVPTGGGAAGPGTGQPSPARANTGRSSTGSPALVGERGSGLGFDACTAPSVATMTAWLASPYRVAGTYLGGDNWACSYGNFSKSWVNQVAAEGWRFIPIWVGPQAPCSTIPGATLISPAKATAEGKAQAASASATAASFGYGTGTPVYFDMEGYDSSNTSCKHGVLHFLDGWTQGLHAAGYTSGVYSSAASGIADLASEYGKPGYDSPDDIWIADWTGDPVLTDPNLPNRDWPSHQRLHQYYGGHLETWGSASVDVDNDVIDGAVAGLSHATPPPAAFVADQPDAANVAPGGHTVVQLTIGATGGRAGGRVHWQVQAAAGLTVSPDHGVSRAKPGHPVVLPLTVKASSSAAPGRYDLPVTAAVGVHPLTQTFELVSVAAAGASLPTAQPVVLYAADPASMAAATGVAHALALPAADLTGSFDTAWTDLTGGQDVLLAVGQAAENALNTNPCGWSNPAGTGAGSTPFFYAGAPLQQSAGADVFENAAGGRAAGTAAVTARLMHYALTGDLPDEGAIPPGPSVPTTACLGAPDVPSP
jgi:Domain of unknown function (DUF1906)